MDILNTLSLESNKQIKINFNGGDLSSDAGLLLIKEFAHKIGLTSLVRKLFKTNDTALMRFHSDPDNLMQMIYQIIAAYFEDNCADELTNDPIFTSILNKNCLASQPTLSRFWNRMDEDTLKQLDQIDSAMRKVIYSIKRPDFMLFDLDSTLLNTYGKQEGEGFDFGAFVDIGVHQDGLVHISQLADHFVKHPLDVVKVGDIVNVKVLSVDTARKKISLSMKGVPQE